MNRPSGTLKINLKRVFAFMGSCCLILCSNYAQSSSQFEVVCAPRELSITTDSFIAPNEYEFYSFDDSLKNKEGVLIAVGTFRAFHAASVGSFSRVYLLDYNQRAVDFNKAFTGLIKESADRKDFLNRLYGRADVSTLIEGYHTGDVAKEKLQAELKVLSKESFDKGTTLSTDGFMYNMIDFVLNPKAYQKSFLGSNKRFKTLKKYIDNESLFILQGSLSGQRVVSWLASQLISLNLRVSVLDMSNVKDYIKTQQRQFLTNLEKLPWSPDAVIHHTVDGAKPIDYRIGFQFSWGYYSTRVSQYLDSLSWNIGGLERRDQTKKRLEKVAQSYHHTRMCSKILSNN